MKKKLLAFQILFVYSLLFTIPLAKAQTLPGTYSTSWVGNTFAPSARSYDFVQNWANSMFVEDNGTIYANANWDEGAKELGIYRNGTCVGEIPFQHEHADGGAITANATYIWASVHNGKISRFNKLFYGESGTEFGVSTASIRGLAASATELFVSDNANSLIKVYSATTQGSFLRSWAVTRPGPLAMDASGNIWVLTFDANSYGPGTGACIKEYSAAGTLITTITLAAGVEAKSIAIDKVNNELLVTDISNNMQVHIYNNINTTPVFTESIGTQGGILSGTKGLVAPLKFNVPNLVGVDANHNIIIWSNGNNPDKDKTVDGDGMGTSLESYTRAGVLNWQMLGLEFVDMGAFDPTTNGADLYTKHEHFTMDYSKPDGQQWTWKGWTLDRNAYATSDARLTNNLEHISTPYIRVINGQKFMFITTMYGGGFYIYRFGPDEILIPCGEIRYNSGWTDNNANGLKDPGETTLGINYQYDLFGVCVDNDGAIWYSIGGNIRKHSIQSITNGVPIYNTTTPNVTTSMPAPFNDVRRVQYDSDNDIMYISGYTSSRPFTDDWKSCGLVLARYNNWSTGNRAASYTINLPSTTAGDGGNMVSTAIEKDYIFVMGVQTRGKLWVYNSSTGVLLGNMVPGANVGGVSKTGWGDMVNSLSALKKSSGEYLITVEENGWGKVLIYRWNIGNVLVSGITVNPTAALVDVGGTQQISAAILPADATDGNVTWTTSNSSVATVSTTGLVTGKAVGTATITATSVADGTKTATCAVTVQASAITNLAPLGNAYGWLDLSSSATDDTKIVYNGLNDNILTDDVVYPDASAAGNWQAAGIVWATPQNNITSVKFYNGVCNQLAENGVFSADIRIQSTVNGTTWTDISGWTCLPVYPYSAAASNVIYTFSGNSIGNVMGIRIIGQVETNDSWSIKVKELQVLSGSASSVAVTGVTLNPTTATINVGAQQQLTATIIPANATNNNVSWASSNTSIATVSATGLITAVAGGTATITVTTLDGSKTANCLVTVSVAPGTWIVADDLDPNWSWGSYFNDPCVTCYQGSGHYSNTINCFGQFSFTGTEVEAYAETFAGAGSVNIFIDGVLKGSFSQDFAPYGGAKKFASFTGLTDGVHTIKFVGTTTNWTGIDYIRFRSFSVLPLDIISFNAQLVNGKTYLKWVTENELNISHFDIERSNDGNRFNKIKEIASHGNGSYNTVDEVPLTGYNYYRLKMVDKDGKFSYSIVEVVKDLNDVAFSFTMYPNPNKGLLTIAPSQLNIPVAVSIFDQQGRLVLVKQITGKSSFSINHLANGVYTVRLSNDATFKTVKLIKE